MAGSGLLLEPRGAWWVRVPLDAGPWAQPLFVRGPGLSPSVGEPWAGLPATGPLVPGTMPGLSHIRDGEGSSARRRTIGPTAAALGARRRPHSCVLFAWRAARMDGPAWPAEGCRSHRGLLSKLQPLPLAGPLSGERPVCDRVAAVTVTSASLRARVTHGAFPVRAGLPGPTIVVRWCLEENRIIYCGRLVCSEPGWERP